MSRLAIAALVGVVVTASGCAETLVRTKLNISSLALSSIQATINRDGIGVGAQLLGFVELQQGRAPSIEVRWREIDVAMARAQNARQGEEPTKPMSARVPLVPVPSMFLAIDNRSGSVIDFKGAKVWLESTKGQKYPAVLSVVDVASRADVYLREKYPNAAQSEEVVEGLRERVSRVPLFHDKLVIQPGTRFDGILVLDLPAFSIKETDAALAGDEKFTLKLTALGGGSEPLEISIPFERTSAAIQVDCPQGKPATSETCKLPKL
jgi:hypothetical protein